MDALSEGLSNWQANYGGHLEIEEKKLAIQREKLEFFNRKMESKAEIARINAENARVQADGQVEAAREASRGQVETARSTKMQMLYQLWQTYTELSPQLRAMLDALAKELGMDG